MMSIKWEYFSTDSPVTLTGAMHSDVPWTSDRKSNIEGNIIQWRAFIKAEEEYNESAQDYYSLYYCVIVTLTINEGVHDTQYFVYDLYLAKKWDNSPEVMKILLFSSVLESAGSEGAKVEALGEAFSYLHGMLGLATRKLIGAQW